MADALNAERLFCSSSPVLILSPQPEVRTMPRPHQPTAASFADNPK
jgi:hypothetical protein